MRRSFVVKLSALCLIMTLPLWGILAFKWPISSDLIFYATSAKAFSSQFWEGDLYPRWLMNTNAGFGSPVFVFYSPMAFYAMSLFEFLAPFDTHGFGRIFIGMMMSIMVAGITSYRWLSKQTDREMAEKGALLYAGFPYLLLHIYLGFAVAQLWGVALFPLLMEAAYDVTKKGWKALPRLSVAYALLCCTHLPSMVMFACVPCLYILVFSPRGKRMVSGVLAGGFALLGISLSAIYLLPVLLNKGNIVTQGFLNGNLNYANNFMDTWSQLGFMVLIMPLFIMYFEVPKPIRKSIMNKSMYFWIVVEAGFIFMILPLSKPLWDITPALQHLQFPFRFFLAMLPGAVFITLQMLPHVKSKNLYRNLLFIGLICSALYTEGVSFFNHQTPTVEILKNNLFARPEYQTRWMEKAGIDFRTHVPQRFLEMKSANIVEGKGTASIVEQGARYILLHTDITSHEAKVDLQRFYFPGWQAETKNISVTNHDALISLQLPKGSRDIRLVLPWLIGEREGMIISIGAFITLWTLYAFSRLQARPARPITKT